MISQLQTATHADIRQRARAAILSALDDLGGEAAREPLLTRALTDGDFRDWELAVPAPTETRARYSSDVTYRLARALHQLRADGLIDCPAWNTWRRVGSIPPPTAPEITISTPPPAPPRSRLSRMLNGR